ncbi:MAG: inositol monophosphatase family protein [Clostridiaceae bacterium]|nr:inositol monophosphatase family protein [Clostridiaceae bacterium]
MNTWQELLGPVRQIVLEAGRLIIGRQGDELQITEKSAANYVTEMDLAVQQLIVGRLTALTPDYAIIAEESKTNPYGSARPTWILDPVDGTTNLMRNYRHSAVSLALLADNRLQLGLVLNPYAAECFSAVAGQGAWLNDRPISVSRHDRLQDCLVGFGTTPYARDKAHFTFDLAERVFLQSLEIRRSGSAALDIVYVACGRLDGFFEMQLQPWDYAAGALILQEAGGQITNWNGIMPALSHADSILATNGLIHGDMRRLIANQS